MKNIENRNALNDIAMEMVAGGVPILHPVRKYEDPPAEPEEPVEGGAQGTW